MDREGYPLYPNRNTTFVLQPGAQITNFGNVGYSKTTSNEKSKDNRWKVIRVRCLGVLLCDSEDCDYAGPPPTGQGKIEELIGSNRSCPASGGECPGKVHWQACTGTRLRFDIEIGTGWGLLRHTGFHNHPWPDPKKPDPLAKKMLALEVAKNPKAGALQLKVRASHLPSFFLAA
ncbi:uncharacterized protein PGTG_22420 [Puccinia graminis f. sp. tritici CRL 75-36-700-3]|uniref:Uncharacterized protein n=1 Tax=Puccinia graminis f. sp. tritici (strain CRL 75-36-700-3 / race SCCL) TaxID=418459 RepID=H6QUL0_PUCGT|nr:uncharacterized protein PGTG_22420 [Puccinia graminis f. sp. tritici CRL 75-36-700-3]EHS64724.1 hypothetical protein PGTG_22420 [Puccinia graminis f. sp. tritici CRL 75-36-700-3]